MTNQFTYSILQYRHSLLLNESINVGIVFSFPNSEEVYFVSGNTQRVKCAYPEFDNAFFNSIIKSIKNNLSHKPQDLFSINNTSFRHYLNTLLIPDSTSLQFSEPFTAIDSFGNSKKASEEFSKILLPNYQIIKEEEYVHNEQYILRRLTDSIIKKDISIEHRMQKNIIVEGKNAKLRFDLGWKNGVTHLIKPISFDLKVDGDIQDKSVRFFGYLNLLKGAAQRNDYVYDFLIGKPTNPQLLKSYENALKVLNEADAPKEIITEERIEEYSEKTAEVLKSKGLDYEIDLPF